MGGNEKFQRQMHGYVYFESKYEKQTCFVDFFDH